MTYVAPAKSVVYRSKKYKFEVDGQPFPWLVTEQGASFARVTDNLYRVGIEIVPLLFDTRQLADIKLSGPYPAMLSLLDRPFPWAISDSIDIHASRTEVATIRLAFLADSVDTDTDVVDARGRAVYDLDGSHYGGQEHCPHCDAPTDSAQLLEHCREHHPEMLRERNGETAVQITPTSTGVERTAQ